MVRHDTQAQGHARRIGPSPFTRLVNRRFSLRRFDLSRPVADKDVVSILEAARLAPSAENTQPWRFVVVRNPQGIAELAKQCFSGIFSATKFAAESSCIVALCADRAKFLERAGEVVLRTALYQLDCGIAGEHIALAAAELGIGSCWIGWFNKKRARKLLGLPLHVELVALIALGYAKEGVSPRGKNRKPLSELTSMDRWGTPFPPAQTRETAGSS